MNLPDESFETGYGPLDEEQKPAAREWDVWETPDADIVGFTRISALCLEGEGWRKIRVREVAPEQGPEFRYFTDEDGSRWKMPTDNSRGFYWSRSLGGWIDQPTNLSGILRDVKRDGTIETDANGTPLPCPSSPSS